jgi:hypothetical protein
MTLSIADAAAHAKVSAATIHKLIKLGHIAADHPGPHKSWTVTTPKQEIRKIVAEHSPSSGWTKHAKPKPKLPRVVRRTRPEVGMFKDALVFAGLDAVRRTALLALAARFTPDELQLLLSL